MIDQSSAYMAIRRKYAPQVLEMRTNLAEVDRLIKQAANDLVECEEKIKELQGVFTPDSAIERNSLAMRRNGLRKSLEAAKMAKIEIETGMNAKEFLNKVFS